MKHLYEPCFCKGDAHLSKEGLAPSTPFTYRLEEKTVNTKTIEQLISEFSAKVTAFCQACALHKRQKAPTPDEDSERSQYDTETDVEETPKKRMKFTPTSTAPATTKPPPSTAVGRAPKGTSID